MHKLICKIAMVLVLVGALNWGLIAVANFNLVDKTTSLVTKDNAQLNKAVYILVALAALLVAYKKLTRDTV